MPLIPNWRHLNLIHCKIHQKSHLNLNHLKPFHHNLPWKNAPIWTPHSKERCQGRRLMSIPKELDQKFTSLRKVLSPLRCAQHFLGKLRMVSSTHQAFASQNTKVSQSYLSLACLIHPSRHALFLNVTLFLLLWPRRQALSSPQPPYENLKLELSRQL